MSRQIHDQRLIRALRAMNSELTASNRAVAARTRMGTTTMTSVLRRLIRDGWIERRPSETDLRSFTIHATSIDRLAEIFLPANRKLIALVEDWPETQVDQLIEFLEAATEVIHESADLLSAEEDIVS